METKVYAIRDKKAESFMQPFFATNAALALRTFADHANNPDTIFAKHPFDFVLYEIGLFNDQTGAIENTADNINLGSAADYINQPETPDQMRLA